jgi:hypothetical protein
MNSQAYSKTVYLFKVNNKVNRKIELSDVIKNVANNTTNYVVTVPNSFLQHDLSYTISHSIHHQYVLTDILLRYLIYVALKVCMDYSLGAYSQNPNVPSITDEAQLIVNCQFINSVLPFSHTTFSLIWTMFVKSIKMYNILDPSEKKKLERSINYISNEIQTLTYHPENMLSKNYDIVKKFGKNMTIMNCYFLTFYVPTLPALSSVLQDYADDSRSLFKYVAISNKIPQVAPGIFGFDGFFLATLVNINNTNTEGLHILASALDQNETQYLEENIQPLSVLNKLLSRYYTRTVNNIDDNNNNNTNSTDISPPRNSTNYVAFISSISQAQISELQAELITTIADYSRNNGLLAASIKYNSKFIFTTDLDDNINDSSNTSNNDPKNYEQYQSIGTYLPVQQKHIIRLDDDELTIQGPKKPTTSGLNYILEHDQINYPTNDATDSFSNSSSNTSSSPIGYISKGHKKPHISRKTNTTIYFQMSSKDVHHPFTQNNIEICYFNGNHIDKIGQVTNAKKISNTYGSELFCSSKDLKISNNGDLCYKNVIFLKRSQYNTIS